MTLDNISQLIKKRRSVFPKTYRQNAPIERAIIEQVQENANWAPTHRLTQPWRFQVFHSEESRTRLAGYLSDYYQKTTPEAAFSEEKFQKTKTNPLRSGAVIAIIMHRDEAERVPEFEELAAVSMAVQNMWLTCAAINLGCYWSTPPAAIAANKFLELAPNESCLGLFYMGWHDLPEMAGKRDAIGEKIRVF